MAYLQLDGADGGPRSLFVDIAEQELGRAVVIAPDYPPTLYNLAVVALSRGDRVTARGYLDRLRTTGHASAAVALLERAVGNAMPTVLGLAD